MALRTTSGGAVALDTWTSLVKAAGGALGFVLVALGPVLKADSFPALPTYAFVLGGVLVAVAATMRVRPLLIVLGCLALSAGLAATLVGHGDPLANRSALALYCAAAVTFGSVGRRWWMAIPFLLIPLLVVAPGTAGWGQGRDAFAHAWSTALACDCLWAGLPAGLAIVGAAIGEASARPWTPVKPSAFPLLILCAGVLLAGLVLASVLPDALATARQTCVRTALLAGVLGWVALAYQAGRLALVWQAALACLLVLGGAVFVDAQMEVSQAFNEAFAITVLTSLLPAVLAGLGLLVRLWIGKERPKVVIAAPIELRPVERKGYFAPPPPPEAVLPTPLRPTGFARPSPEPKVEEPVEPEAAAVDPDDEAIP